LDAANPSSRAQSAGLPATYFAHSYCSLHGFIVHPVRGQPQSYLRYTTGEPLASQLRKAYIIAGSAHIIWGLEGYERARRLLERAGLDVADSPGLPAKVKGSGLLMRANTVIDEGLIRALVESPNTALIIPNGDGFRVLAIHATNTKLGSAAWFLDRRKASKSALEKSGFKTKSPEELGGTYNAALRKTQAPYAFDLEQTDKAQIEAETFKAVYKGVTDFVTKFIWPPIALPITQVCARAKISPNAVTFISLILVLAATYWFWQGQFWLGIIAGWLAALADTVDGKLARVTLTSSKWGNVFDHGIDLIHPPFWWLAWWHGVWVSTGVWLDWAMYIVVGGYVAGKLLEQAFISTFRLKVHIWQKLDSTFRLFTARRNPNMAILTIFSAIGAYETGYLALAAWTIFCFGFHGVRYFQARAARKSGQEIASWLDAS